MPRSVSCGSGLFCAWACPTAKTLTYLGDILSFQSGVADVIASPPRQTVGERDMMTSSGDDRFGYEAPKGGQDVTPARFHSPINTTVSSGREEYPSDDATRRIVAIFGKALEVFTGLCEELRPMTPDRVKSIREGLGLSQEAFSQVLRLGAHGKRTVARWEAGDNPVPGPASVALEALEAGWRPGDGCWRDMRAGYLAVLDVIEKAIQTAREEVRSVGAESSERSPGVE